MFPDYFALIGVAIASVGGLYYWYSTIIGSVKPNKITWFFWGAFPMIAFAAQATQEVSLVLWITFVSGFMPLLIFVASFWNPKAYWKIRTLDYLFAAIGVFAIGLWYITKNPNLAITFSMVADLAVSMPTIVKTYTNPETETWKTYAFNSLGFGLGVLSVQVWTYENYSFVVYLFLINLGFTFLAFRKSKSTF